MEACEPIVQGDYLDTSRLFRQKSIVALVFRDGNAVLQQQRPEHSLFFCNRWNCSNTRSDMTNPAQRYIFRINHLKRINVIRTSWISLAEPVEVLLVTRCVNKQVRFDCSLFHHLFFPSIARISKDYASVRIDTLREGRRIDMDWTVEVFLWIRVLREK